MKQAIVLSPHYDDAILHMGCAIQSMLWAGWRVHVINVFTDYETFTPHDPDPAAALLFAARKLYGTDLLRSAKDYALIRQMEDNKAMEVIGRYVPVIAQGNFSWESLGYADFGFRFRNSNTEDPKHEVDSLITRLIQSVRSTGGDVYLFFPRQSKRAHRDHRLLSLVAQRVVLSVSDQDIEVSPFLYRDLASDNEHLHEYVSFSTLGLGTFFLESASVGSVARFLSERETLFETVKGRALKCYASQIKSLSKLVPKVMSEEDSKEYNQLTSDIEKLMFVLPPERFREGCYERVD